jgi:hypothetical protein
VPEEIEARKERDIHHLTPQFPITVQKYYLDSISRTDGALNGSN